MKIGKNSPSPPPAPDPVATAKAQSDANIATAQEQQRLNMINTSGPTGTVSYVADPNAPGGYSQNTTLSPQEQASYDLSKQAGNSALQTANTQIGRVNDALANPLDLSKLPGLTSSISPGQYQSTFDQGQAIQGQIGGNLDQARQQAIDAVYGQATSRLDPMYAQRESQLRTRLANQGFADDATGAQASYDQLGRDRNDAYNQAAYSSIGAGEDAANALFGRQATQGQFANQAAGQMYSQNLGAAQFGNQAQDQQLQAQIAAGTFGNQARQQALQEQAYVQNQPINQFTALLGSGQVGTPQGVQYSPTQVGQTDVIGAQALATQAQQQAYQAKMSQQSGLMGGLFSLGSAAILASDIRLKRDVIKLGERPDGVGVFSYRYLWDDTPHIGAIAQDVQRVRPDLVIRRGDGSLAVNYAGL